MEIKKSKTLIRDGWTECYFDVVAETKDYLFGRIKNINSNFHVENYQQDLYKMMPNDDQWSDFVIVQNEINYKSQYPEKINLVWLE